MPDSLTLLAARSCLGLLGACWEPHNHCGPQTYSSTASKQPSFGSLPRARLNVYSTMQFQARCIVNERKASWSARDPGLATVHRHPLSYMSSDAPQTVFGMSKCTSSCNPCMAQPI
jgi:hypothetical protein